MSLMGWIWVMSAPAMKFFPVPVRMIALTAAVSPGLDEGIGHFPDEMFGKLVYGRVVEPKNRHPIFHFHFHGLVIRFHSHNLPGIVISA